MAKPCTFVTLQFPISYFLYFMYLSFSLVFYIQYFAFLLVFPHFHSLFTLFTLNYACPFFRSFALPVISSHDFIFWCYRPQCIFIWFPHFYSITFSRLDQVNHSLNFHYKYPSKLSIGRFTLSNSCGYNISFLAGCKPHNFIKAVLNFCYTKLICTSYLIILRTSQWTK